jgi:hypothetical protein
MLLALTTGHKIGLALSGALFIAFALLSAVVVPRRRPDFPGRALPAFLVATVVLFVGMLAAVEIFGAEPKESAKPEQPTGASPGDVATGRRLAASLGCTGCHSEENTASGGVELIARLNELNPASGERNNQASMATIDV